MIESGTRLGPYEVTARIGAGGMGEVYRARDSRLDRSVAIKVLPPHLSSDPRLRERFQREAKAISSLVHPHICTLHDVGSENGIDYLVMEYVEGESLAERLERGPLPPEQVVRYGIEIAEALQKAHRAGIVHRDLKPGNVMLTKDGAKLLDFGLAKIAQPPIADPNAATAAMSHHKPLTEEGSILGTFQYMAPEQIEGREADARTDIFSFGTLLYEMATATRAFDAKSKASLIASILDRDPPPISTIQPLTPPALERVIRLCLAKDPDDRWQSAHDIAAELKWIAEGHTATPRAIAQRTRWREYLAWTTAGLLLAAAIAIARWKDQKDDARSTYSSIVAPPGTTMLAETWATGSLTISPDGRMVTFSARQNGKEALWLQDLASGVVRPLAFTEDGSFPFWSPDSRHLAFFANGKLKKIDVNGGPAITLADAEEGRSGSWNSDGVIIFAPHWRLPIHRVSANGGTAVPITKIDEARETTHRWATFLPDGKHFLYLAGSHLAESDSDRNAIYVASLDGRERKHLMHARSNAVYSSKHLLFVRDRFLIAQPFDPDKLTLTGEPRPIAENVQYSYGFLRASFAASDDGTLVYHPASPEPVSTLHWMDRTTGALGAPLATAGDVEIVTLSPDGTRALTSEGMPADLWLIDLRRGTRTRVTTHMLNDHVPVWSPDGQKIAFMSDRTVDFDVYVVKPEESGNGEPLIRWSDSDDRPSSWTSDGRYVIVSRGQRSGSSDIWVVPLSEGEKPFPYRQSPSAEFGGAVSPDGKWMTFVSDHSGRDELYVAPFPGPGTATQVSTTGAGEARWRSDGREIVFGAGGEVMAVPIQTSPSLVVGTPQRIESFGAKHDWWPRLLSADFNSDFTRSLVALREGQPPNVPVTLVQNWPAALRR